MHNTFYTLPKSNHSGHVTLKVETDDRTYQMCEVWISTAPLNGSVTRFGKFYIFGQFREVLISIW